MSTPDLSVSDRHVLISGGTGGIGTAFARAFRSAGAQVAITDIKPPATDEGFPFELLDVRSDEPATALVARTGKLDVPIHCAGRLLRHDEHNPEIFMDIVNIHLGGNMRLASAFRPTSRRRSDASSISDRCTRISAHR